MPNPNGLYEIVTGRGWTNNVDANANTRETLYNFAYCNHNTCVNLPTSSVYPVLFSTIHDGANCPLICMSVDSSVWMRGNTNDVWHKVKFEN